MVNQTVADATYDVLRRFGVDRVFGNPGSTEMRLFVRWPDDLDYVLALQEASVVAMADGFAQRSRRPSVANVHTAAGLGNAMGSLITAWRNQTPLVITAGQQTRAMLPTEPYLSSPQSILLPQPYVKWAIEPARAADVPGAVARALLAATTPPSGPAFVSIPEDDWDAEPAPVPSHTVVPALGADPRAIERFAEILTAAIAPAIVVGPQVDGDGAGADAVALAERLKAAVYVAPWSSRCSFPERHPLFQGFLTASRQEVVRQLDGHDAVLVVGAQIFTYHVHTMGRFCQTVLRRCTSQTTQSTPSRRRSAIASSAQRGWVFERSSNTSRHQPVGPDALRAARATVADGADERRRRIAPACGTVARRSRRGRGGSVVSDIAADPSAYRRTGWFLQWIQRQPRMGTAGGGRGSAGRPVAPNRGRHG